MKKYTWLKAAGFRAVRTVAQTAVATIGTSKLMGDVNWIAVGSASLLAGILSILTSVITTLPEVDDLSSLDEFNEVQEVDEEDGQY